MGRRAGASIEYIHYVGRGSTCAATRTRVRLPASPQRLPLNRLSWRFRGFSFVGGSEIGSESDSTPTYDPLNHEFDDTTQSISDPCDLGGERIGFTGVCPGPLVPPHQQHRLTRSGATLPTLPKVHRLMLLALLTDLVQQWAEAEPTTLTGPFASLLDRAPPRNRPLKK